MNEQGEKRCFISLNKHNESLNIHNKRMKPENASALCAEYRIFNDEYLIFPKMTIHKKINFHISGAVFADILRLKKRTIILCTWSQPWYSLFSKQPFFIVVVLSIVIFSEKLVVICPIIYFLITPLTDFFFF